MVAPVEPAETVIRLVADDVPLDDLICQGWMNRPELARARELVQAAVLRLKQAKLRPFVPSLAVTYSGGGFGGGSGFVLRQLQHPGRRGGEPVLGAERPRPRRSRPHPPREAERHTADIDLVRVQAQVANDVVAAYKARRRGGRGDGRRSCNPSAEAIESLELNLTNIRRGAGLPGATRPIEVLQPIQALAQARTDYLAAVLAYNRAQFRLIRAIGWPTHLAPNASQLVPVNGRPTHEPGNNVR